MQIVYGRWGKMLPKDSPPPSICYRGSACVSTVEIYHHFTPSKLFAYKVVARVQLYNLLFVHLY